LYESAEIQTSEEYLKKIFKLLKGNTCLLGGWAAHHIVNENFKKTTGRNYIGSRDIDIGFHIDKNWSVKQLRKSEFCTALKQIENMGFQPISFRLAKYFNLETSKELTPTESAKLSLHEILRLYVDPVVDYIHPKIKPILGFVPIDEPLLSYVFAKKLSTTTKLYGTNVLIPQTHVLLAMKLNSVINRDKEDKRIKDIADIYALLWHSNTKITQLKKQLYSIYPPEKARNTTQTFTKTEIQNVSKNIGVETDKIARVLTELR
jgi:hypothetical protein